MEALEIVKLCALAVQLLGIGVAAGMIFESVLAAPPLRALLTVLNIVIRTHAKGTIREYDISEDINKLYKKASHPTYLLLPIIVVPIDLIFSLGLWVLLWYRIYQLFTYGVEIKWFWIVFVVWFLLLAWAHLYPIPAQLAISGRIVVNKRKDIETVISESASSKPSDWVKQFLRNWYTHPLALIKPQAYLLLVTIMLLPAWVLRPIYAINLSSKKQRQRYYLAYATTALLVSTFVQIMVVVLH